VNDEDAADSSVQKPVIASFSVDSALVLVGAEVELRCRVSRVNGGMFVRLSKWVLGTTNYEVLTTNMVKEQSIRDIERYSISAEQYGDHGGYDFIFTISGSYVILYKLPCGNCRRDFEGWFEPQFMPSTF